MKPIIIKDTAFTPSFEKLAQEMHVKPDHPNARGLRALLDEAVEIAQPKAIYKIAHIQSKTKDSVSIEGYIFKSRLLRAHLESVHRVFPYVASCGRELYEWQRSQKGVLEQYYADAISSFALESVRQALIEHLEDKYKLGQTASMAPGSLEDWPISEQRALFSLIGDTEKSIGVELMDSLLMVPGQTVSGIRFQSESTFESCQLCQKENCPNRKANFLENSMDDKLKTITER